MASLQMAALQTIALACAGTLSAAALAQNLPFTNTTIAHRILAGDTLEHLAQRYLGDATLWPVLQRHNRVDNPYRLKPGSVLEIPLQLMRAATASVDYVQGNAHVNRGSNGSTHATAVTRGMPLQEGDQIKLDPNAFVTVRLADGSTVRVQATSMVELSQLRRRGRSGSLQSVLAVQQGGIEVQVPGKPDAQRRLEVITPVAATSVRGTRFDVQLLAQGGTTTAVLSGRVAVKAQADAAHSAPSAVLLPQTGIRVSANGQAGPVTALLPAASAAALPTLNEDAQWLNLPMPDWTQASGWRVTVSADAQGQQVLRHGQFDGALARFVAIPDGNYFLQARAIDKQGISGMPASVPLRVKAHPVPPLAQTPAPGAVLAQGEAQLQCTPVDGVVGYHHQVIALATAESATPPAAFAQTLLEHKPSNGTQCSLDLRQLPIGNYAWRAASVRMVQGQPDQGPFGQGHAFRIATRPPAPSLDDMKLQTQAGLSTIYWLGEAGQRFRLQAFASPQADTTPALDTLLETPQWTAGGLPPGTWHVRIQIQDPSGLHSAFSPLRSVRVLALVRDGFGHPVSSGTGLGIEHP
jgi:hypothetical protein